MASKRYVWIGKCRDGHTDRLYSRDRESLPGTAQAICDKVLRDPEPGGRAVGVCGEKQAWKYGGPG